MSLLLDALNRASLDKAQASSGSTLALEPLKLVPESPQPVHQPKYEPAKEPVREPTASSVAQEILRAHNNAVAPKPKHDPSRRLFALSALALVIASAMAAWFLLEPENETHKSALPTISATNALPATSSTVTPSANLPTLAADNLPGATAPSITPQPDSKVEVKPQIRSVAGAKAPRSLANMSTKGTPVTVPTANSPDSAGITSSLSTDPLSAAYAALKDGQLPEAAHFYNEALKRQPENRDALLGLAHLAHRAGRHEEAISLYQRVLRQEPDQPNALAGLLALQAKADPAHAAGQARDIAQRHPESAAALSALGIMLTRDGRLADAQQAFARAQALEPDNANYAYNLAVCLDQLRRYDSAQIYYERAILLSTAAATGRGFSRASVQQRLDQLRLSTAAGIALQ